MNRPTASPTRPRPLQQQPQRFANQQQQQSSGSGEFQPRDLRPDGRIFPSTGTDSSRQHG